MNNQRSQSINVNEVSSSSVQIGGQAGGNLTVTQVQQSNQGGSETSLKLADVVKLLTHLEDLCRSSLPEAQAKTAIRCLESAREEVQEEKPNKVFAAINLAKVKDVLKEANETVEAGTSLWERFRPIFEAIAAIAPWLSM